jgi:general secretion pathway protein F
VTAGRPYAYRAARRDGAMEIGVVDADSRDAAASLLATRGLMPLELGVAEHERPRHERMPASDLALGLRLLATLLEAHLPVARALAAFDELAPPAWKGALPGIRAAVSEGAGLAGALANAPLGIPPIVTGILRAGEAGSGLAAAVSRAAQLAERNEATRQALRGALAYPILLAAAGTASVGFLVSVVLPRFATILADLGQSLPPTTRAVLAVAGLVRVAALPGLLLAGAGWALWRAWVATPAGHAAWHGWLLDLPVLGTIRHCSASAHATGALSALLESGVPVATALAHAARAVGDAAVEQRLTSAREAIVGGERLSRALTETGAVTATTVRLVRAGEDSGRLAAMLAHAERLESGRAEQLTRSAVRVLEPALIVSFGGIVAFVAAALLQAVYSVRPGVGGGP